METINQFLEWWETAALLTRLVLSSIPMTIVALVTKDYWLPEARYRWLNFTLHFPVIGKIARKSKEIQSPHNKNGALWTPNEEEIAQPFYDFYKDVDTDPDIYAKSENYLHKVGEAGMRPMPLWMIIMVVGLVFVEAIGFGFAVAPYAAINVTASQVTLVASLTALLMAIISCGFAHMAGEESARNSKIRLIRHSWQSDPASDKGALARGETLSLAKTYEDNNQPKSKYWEVMLNRIEPKDPRVQPTYHWHIAMIVVVLICGVLALVLRYEGLQANLTEVAQSAGIEQGGVTAGQPNFQLSDSAASTIAQSSQQSADERMGSLKRAFYTTFVLLSIVYVAVQAIMYALTAKYTMVGEKSVVAWKNTHRYPSKDALLNARERIRRRVASDADRALQKLRANLRGMALHGDQQKAMESGECSKKGFVVFCVNRDQDLIERTKNNSGNAGTSQGGQTSGQQSTASASTPTAPVAPTATSLHAVGTSAVDSSSMQQSDRDSVLRKIVDSVDLTEYSDQDLADCLWDLQHEFAAAWLTADDLGRIKRSQELRKKRAGKVA